MLKFKVPALFDCATIFSNTMPDTEPFYIAMWKSLVTVHLLEIRCNVRDQQPSSSKFRLKKKKFPPQMGT